MQAWGKIKEAAVYSGLKSRKFRDLLKAGLPHSRLPGGCILVKFSDIDAFLKKFSNSDQEAMVDRLVVGCLGGIPGDGKEKKIKPGDSCHGKKFRSISGLDS